MAYTYPGAHLRRKLTNDFAPFGVRRYGRHWEVRDPSGEIICLTVYRRGAAEVVRRLKARTGVSRSEVCASQNCPRSLDTPHRDRNHN